VFFTLILLYSVLQKVIVSATECKTPTHWDAVLRYD